MTQNGRKTAYFSNTVYNYNEHQTILDIAHWEGIWDYHSPDCTGVCQQLPVYI